MPKLSYIPTKGYKSINENVLPLTKGQYKLMPIAVSEKSKANGKGSVQVRVLRPDGTPSEKNSDIKTWLDATFVGFKEENGEAVFYNEYIADFAVGAGFTKCVPVLTTEEEEKAKADADKKTKSKK